MFGKLHKRMYYGSLYGQSDAQSLMAFLIAHADREGFVEMVPEAVTAPLGWSLERFNEALKLLMSPDLRSTSPEEDGRRLVPIDERGWGWKIVNYQFYRGIRDPDDRRRQVREAVSRYRARKQLRITPDNGNQGSSGKAYADADADAEERNTLLSPRGDVDTDFGRLWKQYPHYGHRSSKAKSLARWKALRPKPGITEVLKGLAACALSDDWQREGGRFVPACEVWIGKRGWDSSEGTNGVCDDPVERMRRKMEAARAGQSRPS